MRKVLLIGSTGFVGRHIADELTDGAALFVTTRQRGAVGAQTIHFDFTDVETWVSVVNLAPDVIVNAAGYGVVKEQTDLEMMYDVNYRQPAQLISHLQAKSLMPFWLQIGTAFEYDLTEQQLHETSACVPFTHYGMSKYLCSNFLVSEKNKLPYLILRPFAMFGAYESDSKFIPYLINAQREGRRIDLSTGEQQRDYFYVKDLSRLIKTLVAESAPLPTDKILNIGRGVAASLKELAMQLSKAIPDFNPSLWNWGALPQRDNENQVFFNASTKAVEGKLKLTPIEEAFRQTVSYYFQQ